MKRKLLRILFFMTSMVIVILIIGASYIKIALPDVGDAPDMAVDMTASRIARGRYLADNVMVCMQCHSQRDWTKFAAPLKPETKGAGGEIHDQRLGLPGKYVSTNLTPYALADWSDGEIFRAITTGVNKDGKALFPIMPHHNFGKLDEEDIKSVIAYLRTLKPIQYNPESSSSDFPMNFIVNFIPQKAMLKPAPSSGDKVAYGKYLTTAGTCFDCHTKQDAQGNFVGPHFGGGNEFRLEDGSVVRSANITPHTTGIGNWSSQMFVQRFKFFQDSSYVAHRVGEGEFQTVMPWNTYAGMAEEDLLAIYEYLKTIPPADGVIEKFTTAYNQSH